MQYTNSFLYGHYISFGKYTTVLFAALANPQDTATTDVNQLQHNRLVVSGNSAVEGEGWN